MKRGIKFFIDSFLKLKMKSSNIRKRSLPINLFLLLYVGALFYILYYSIAEVGYSGFPAIAFSVFFALSIVAFFILRIVYFSLSNYVFILIFFVLATYICYRWGVSLSIGLLFYALTIFISGVLINAKFSFFIGLSSSFVIFVIGYLQLHGMEYADYSNNNELSTPDIIIYPVIFGITSVVSWVTNTRSEKLLLESERYRKQLKSNFSKEIIALEKEQFKKITELSRLAKFGKLSSGFFHDLVNPLTAISLNIEKFKSVNNIDEKKDSLDKVVTATENMKRFIEAIRKQVLRPEERINFSVNEEILRSIQILSYKALKSNVQVRFVSDVEIEKYGNTVKFGQIIINLLANAIDAYDNFDKRDKKIIISLSEVDNKAVITIKDNGAGMDDSVEKRVFEPFFTTKKNGEGIGIGLFMVKDIVEKEFKGTITVDTKKGEGTEFNIVFG